MTRTHSSGRLWLVLIGGAACVAAGAWGVSHYTAAAPATEPADPGQMFQRVRETLDRTDLTDEQKRKVLEDNRRQMEARMDAEVNEYFAAAPDKRDAILDKRIDEMQKRMKEFQERHEREGEAASRPAGPPPEARRLFRGAQTPEERKARSESRDPDRMARNMQYWAAMRKRMEERGIKMPFGPGRGGGGGPWGGRRHG